MLKANPPVPLLKKQHSLPERTGDGEPLSPTRSEGGLVGLTPPPVLPKKWTAKRIPVNSNNEKITQELDKMFAKQSLRDTCEAQPPPRSPWLLKDRTDDKKEYILVLAERKDHFTRKAPPPPPKLLQKKAHDKMDADALMDWWKNVTPWEDLSRDLTLRGEREPKITRLKTQHLYNAVQLYILLTSDHGCTLTQYNTELLSIADNLDKVSKGTKIAGITGGATTVVGGVAAAAGVILSPLTLGASLALTVVGVGVAAAGGVTGASAAIAHKVNATQDKKKIEKILTDYTDLVEEIYGCLKFIKEGRLQLKWHDLSILGETRLDSVRVVRELLTKKGDRIMTTELSTRALRLIQGFTLGMEMFFTQGKHGLKMKKGLESKFAVKIRTLVDELGKELDELIKVRDSLNEFNSEE